LKEVQRQPRVDTPLGIAPYTFAFIRGNSRLPWLFGSARTRRRLHHNDRPRIFANERECAPNDIPAASSVAGIAFLLKKVQRQPHVETPLGIAPYTFAFIRGNSRLAVAVQCIRVLAVPPFVSGAKHNATPQAP